ncbi:P-loop containing nucleoside triphosphate hydrolase protein, partial [Mycena latifolia]
LPAQPKILHGRESELRDSVAKLISEPARMAILGPGGIGKTTLAIASLHDPQVVSKYRERHFISCEPAHSYNALLTTISSYFDFEPSPHLARDIVQYLSEKDSILLVLDNLEPAWESMGSRTEVEEFLSLLTGLPHLALLITMRGAERPGKVKWTRPFIPPLTPLTELATRQTFVEIAEEPCAEDEEDALIKLIDLTGGLPLAVSLMASVASLEGYAPALARWLSHSTALLSEGCDKRSNLDISIRASISSPRVQSSRSSMQLLSLLSILPDGMSDHELIHSETLVTDLPQCKSALVRTSLAHVDKDGHLKMLSPIREYVRHAHPPNHLLVRSLRRHFGQLLVLWKTRSHLPSGDLVARLTSNLGNIRNLSLIGLSDSAVEAQRDTIYDLLIFFSFTRAMLEDDTDLTGKVPTLVESLDDDNLWLHYAVSRLGTNNLSDREDLTDLVRRGCEICGRSAVDEHTIGELTFGKEVQ